MLSTFYVIYSMDSLFPIETKAVCIPILKKLSVYCVSKTWHRNKTCHCKQQQHTTIALTPRKGSYMYYSTHFVINKAILYKTVYNQILFYQTLFPPTSTIYKWHDSNITNHTKTVYKRNTNIWRNDVPSRRLISVVCCASPDT